MKQTLTRFDSKGVNLKPVRSHFNMEVLFTYFKPMSMVLAWLVCTAQLLAQEKKFWLTAGQNTSNTRNASSENKISPTTAGNLQTKWEFTTAGDVSANPAVDDQFLYFPDWAGNLYKVNKNTGLEVWRKEFKSYTGQAYAFARATPALSGNTIVIGTQMGSPANGAYVLGISKMNGSLLWKTKVDDHFAAIVTQSAVIQGNKAYVGVASQEEGIAASPGYPCCSFRGSIQCLDVKTGAVLWKTYTTPANPGFSGNAVWGSTPVIDPKRNSLYITTGNNYTVPQPILDCVAAGGSPDAVRACIMAVPGSAQNYFDAIMSLDLATGAVKWAKSVMPFDAWTVDCFFGGPNCPENAGPDYDFGQGPALFTINKKEMLGAGQKSGIYWVLNPENGQEIWHTQVGPGGTLGGLQWGSAVDDKNVYTAVSNNNFTPHLMTKGPGAGQTVNGGFWAALDAATGAVKWEFAGDKAPGVNPQAGQTAINTGMVTVANGVVFGGAMDEFGTMYALNAATGAKLWSFESGGSINSGAAVVDGTVYWGSGYSNFGLGTANNKLYAFGLDGASGASARLSPVSNTIDRAVLVYPSPAKDVMKIVSKDKSNIMTVRLFDLSGKLIKDFKTDGSPTYNLNLSAVTAGTYMINITTATKTSTSQVVVAH
jgi:polyvinyl alcohol dehydrogenase (cytochrome)